MQDHESVFSSGKLKFGDKLNFPDFNFKLKAKWHPDSSVTLERVKKANFPYLSSYYKNKDAVESYQNQRIPFYCALIYPNALKDRIFLVMQCGDMLTIMDDNFTHPKIIDNPNALSILEAQFSHALDGTRPPDAYPIAQLLHDNYRPILETYPSGSLVRKRVRDALKDMITILSHPPVHNITTLTFDEYVDARRIDVFATLMATLIEYAIDVDIGDALEESEDLREMRQATIDLVLFVHDVCSFLKEFSSKEAMNGIWVLARQYDLSIQQAINKLVGLARERERDLIAARNRILASALGQRIDVRRYMTELEHLHSGTVEFHTLSSRYIGQNREGPFISGEVTVEPMILPLHILGPDFIPSGVK
ncbi:MULTISPECIES: terpene synthase family protein [Burkholderia]|uniref:terpene synthase family protein n=1 Tax=Burkholderia TaxID=32008 RepID=UPI0011AF06B4|nr:MULTISPECIES: terpene synthase family protein [unclassified Burkholderia]